MGLLDRVRDAFSTVRETLHDVRVRLSAIIHRTDVPPDVKADVADLARKAEIAEQRASVSEQEVRAVPRTIRERFFPERVEPIVQKRFRVRIQYRPILSGRPYIVHEWEGEADSPEDAIAFAEETLPQEPAYFLSVESERVS